MNDKSKLKRPSILNHPSIRNMIGISSCILLIIAGVLFFLEGPYSTGIIKPKWYRDIRRLISGVAESDQRKKMLAVNQVLESTGIVPSTPSNADPAQCIFEDEGNELDVEKDLWGTPFRCEITNNLLLIRSAGPDKKYDTQDDLVYRK